jgi:superfamily I DNA/RNA helicase
MAYQLTEQQQEVVDHAYPGHGRVLAGPGTGKSFTAVALAEKLTRLKASGLEAPKTKFLTFTRAAAAELSKKLGSSDADMHPPSIMVGGI